MNIGTGGPAAEPNGGFRWSRRVTEADRAAWRSWAQQRAQDAFRRGREATERGHHAEALRWLERAHRLAPDAPAVLFPLALARSEAGDPHGAAFLLRPLLRRYDFREGWVMLAVVCRAAGNDPGAAAAMERALSCFAPDPGIAALATAVAAAADRPGWCGLRGDGTVLVDGQELGAGGARLPPGLELRLDGNVLRGTTRRGWSLPPNWRGADVLEVFRHGASLLGSPIRPRPLVRVDGFVEEVDGELRGWAWHPGEPERAPVLTLRTAAGATRTVALERFTDAVPADTPLARPRVLRFPILRGMSDGPVTVEDADGRALFGSPLDPGLELRAAAAVAAYQARCSVQRFGVPRTGRTGKMTRPPPDRRDLPVDQLPPFLPVTATLVGRSAAVGMPCGVDVVVPVFRHRQRTLDCLHSVLEAISDDVRVVVVEDASPEPELVRALELMAEAGSIQLIRRARNGGFPASANDGIAACVGRDVVLLNSDTLVAPGWLEALRRAAYGQPIVGTATPFSNDASIMSYPRHRDLNPAPDLPATRRLMALAQEANGAATVEVPTGNGFCLYIRRDCLDQVGLLREDLFAQGYGEENDFCLRARHLGWHHVAVPGAYVAHHGNTSFGAARTELMRRNLGILNRLHPGYDELVAAHIAADPLRDFRRRLDAARWRAGRRRRDAGDAVPRAALLLTHDQGGGVERVVRERARLLRARGLRPVLLRPVVGREGSAVAVADGASDEDYSNLLFDLPGEFDAVCALLEGDGVQHGEWHHLLGHHPVLRELCARLGVPFDIYVHDYNSFCQRIALVGPEGRYCGEPDPEGCERCIASQGSALFEDIPVRAMLRRSAMELKQARRVVAPSRDAAVRIGRHFPGVAPEIEAWEDDRPDLTLERLAAVSSQAPRAVGGRRGEDATAGRKMRVAVVGGIGREKGLDVLRACLAEVERRSLPLEFVVIGHTPDDAALIDTGYCFVSGEYREEEAVSLIRAEAADLALLPSIWPETWCFTLSLAWRAGLRVAAFDIGAPAERIKRTGRGVLLPLGLPVPDLVDLLLRLGGREKIVISSPPSGGGTIAERRTASHHRVRARGNG